MSSTLSPRPSPGPSSGPPSGPSPRTTRRGFLGLTGAAAAAAAGAAALPPLGAFGAGAAAGEHRLPAVTHPYHPAALYPEDADDDAPGEPLNAGVECCREGVDA
ncbi:hypothetical protein [Streptomyces radiopugnans]|uniref:Uncharacterized protein n=1 Tax=Streptomyces radiopugnans TaxID=403935 RepID=A0A1H9BJR3_9ACTN|nr:hypothetical protein [Streptomyces radiopugnans]SEP89242.1 hypothetical protein SAMN05216481_102436 [Streptomyces radiopugnans]